MLQAGVDLRALIIYKLAAHRQTIQLTSIKLAYDIKDKNTARQRY